MKPFDYCPACATPLDEPDGEGGLRCPNCGRSWYRNSAPTVAAAIVQEGRVLLAVRGIEPMRGRIDVPGGFLRPGEHPLEGLRREMREELGVEIDVSFEDFLQAIPHTYGAEDDWVLSSGFVASIRLGIPSPADDVAEIIWAQDSELDDLDFAWEHDRSLARLALQRAEGARR